MAAPTSSESEQSDSGDIPEYLNPKSHSFDPKRALYEKAIPPSLATARQFNNLAEFENFLKGKDAKTQQKKKEKQKSISLSIAAVREAAKTTENVRKAAILAKTSRPDQQQQRPDERRRTRPVTSVFTKMEKYKRGPLSLLQKCVEERLRVIVVIRAAVAIRSHCRGYVIAFDKHFNMALMDVDEKLIRPVRKKKKPDIDKRSAHRNDRSLVENTDRLRISRECDPAEQRKDQKKYAPVSEMAFDLRDKIRSAEVKKTTSEKCFSDSEIKSRTMTDKAMQVERTKSKSGTKSDGESDRKTDLYRSSNKKKLKRHCSPFWPLYKEWAEMRCYAHYEIVERHVNQLFIRGDNVVSVSIADL